MLLDSRSEADSDGGWRVFTQLRVRFVVQISAFAILPPASYCDRVVRTERPLCSRRQRQDWVGRSRRTTGIGISRGN
jgi:hypothetical protein